MIKRPAKNEVEISKGISKGIGKEIGVRIDGRGIDADVQADRG